MIRVILNAFLLMTFILAVGFLSISHAQQSTTALTGEWVGNIDSPGRSEFLRLSLTENAGEMRRPLKAKLSLVRLEGSRVQMELSSLKLVMTGTIAGDEIEGEAEVPGTKAHFHLEEFVRRLLILLTETTEETLMSYSRHNGLSTSSRQARRA